MDEYGFDPRKIEKIITGSKYTAVMLKNGDIGVCANLGIKVDDDITDLHTPDLKKIADRIVFNAYLNALLNFRVAGDDNTDICDVIDFSNFKNISMIGYFKPVIERLKNDGIELNIFDLMKNDVGLVPDSEKSAFLKKSDAIILTSTSVSNNTFLETINNIPGDSHVYLLGPSSIMNRFFSVYGTIRMIFGTCFCKWDGRVLDVIGKDGGTRDFQKYGMKKVLNLTGS